MHFKGWRLGGKNLVKVAGGWRKVEERRFCTLGPAYLENWGERIRGKKKIVG